MPSGIVEGIASDVTVSTGRALIRRLFGNQIKITSPVNGGFLEDKRPMLDGFSYVVRGTLKRLPRDHAIWLLNEDPLSKYAWPQGFSVVNYPYPREGEWEGRIFATSAQTDVWIVAVVAPPTSRDFFGYYQEVVGQTNAKPLPRIPIECKNLSRVRARQPITAS